MKAIQAGSLALYSNARTKTKSVKGNKCTSAEPIIYICIQAKEGSLVGYPITLRATLQLFGDKSFAASCE